MKELNNLDKNLPRQENLENQTKRCEEAQAIDAESRPFETSPEMRMEQMRLEPRQKLLYWLNQVYNVGDCTIENMRIFFWSDGRARFEAHVRSSDSDDVWVFYDGISILDNHGVELWRSPKLVGPEMPWEGQTRDWQQEFFYPAIWFDSIDSVKINQMHC